MNEALQPVQCLKCYMLYVFVPIVCVWPVQQACLSLHAVSYIVTPLPVPDRVSTRSKISSCCLAATVIVALDHAC